MKNKMILNDNILFALALSICISIPIINSFEESYLIGIISIIVLILTQCINVLIKKIFKKEESITTYILIISVFLTIVELLLNMYFKNLYNLFNIYLPLTILTYAVLIYIYNKEDKLKIKITYDILYSIVIIIFGFLKELLGNGTITFMNNTSSITGYRSIITIFDGSILPNKLFLTNGGTFILLGIILATLYAVMNRSEL